MIITNVVQVKQEAEEEHVECVGGETGQKHTMVEYWELGYRFSKDFFAKICSSFQEKIPAVTQDF